MRPYMHAAGCTAHCYPPPDFITLPQFAVRYPPLPTPPRTPPFLHPPHPLRPRTS